MRRFFTHGFANRIGWKGTFASAIQHIVFIVKENRSFDEMFGRFPGEDVTTGLLSTGQVIPQGGDDKSSPLMSYARRAPAHTRHDTENHFHDLTTNIHRRVHVLDSDR